MPRTASFVLGSLVTLLVLGGPVFYWQHHQKHFRNFRVVREGVLYRSGQLSLPALKSVIHDYGIKTVVTFRDASEPGLAPPDLAEEKFCAAQEMNFVRISPRAWWSPDGAIPADEGVRAFRAVMDNPANHPVLIHCYAGLHRSGAFSAIYRMEYDHWTNGEAIAEMRANGYKDIEDEWDLLRYLEDYRSHRDRSGR